MTADSRATCPIGTNQSDLRIIAQYAPFQPCRLCRRDDVGRRAPLRPGRRSTRRRWRPRPAFRSRPRRSWSAGSPPPACSNRRRGTGGGVRLARPPAAISLADIVEAVEGPIADDQLRRYRAARLRARKLLPGPPAHGRGQRRGARRAGGRSASTASRGACRHERDSQRNQEAQDAVDRASTYEWGFSDIEQDFAPKGLNEDTVRFISAKKNEPEWMLEWRLKAYRAWLTMEEVSWAKLDIPPIDFQDAYYYAEPKAKPKLGSLDEVDPEILRVYEKLGIPIEEQKVLAGVEGARKVAVDAVFDSVSRRHHLPRGAAARRRHLPLHLRGDPRISRAGAEISRLRGAAARQLFRLPQQRGLLRRHLRLHARGRALPDGAQHLFPDQCREYRPVRAHPDRRRQGQLRLLSRRLHRADARREPAPRRGGRNLRARRCRGEIFDRPELVSGRRRGQGRHLQFRHQAGDVRRRPLQGVAGRRSRPARRSPGNIRPAS